MGGGEWDAGVGVVVQGGWDVEEVEGGERRESEDVRIECSRRSWLDM